MASVDDPPVEAFETALGDLIRVAEREGVQLERARDVEAVAEDRVWMVEITEVHPGDSDGG